MVAENRRSARNAMKHGLCSHLFLAEEHADRIERIRLELVDCFKPRLLLEDRLINDLAVAQFKVFYNENIRYQRLLDERANASDIFDEKVQAEHRRYVAQWRESPIDNLGNLLTTISGARLFRNHWSDILALAESPKGTITLTQILDACMMIGSHWEIQRLTQQGRHLMGLFLALHASEIDAMIDLWADRCKSDCRTMDVAIAQEIFLLAPPADEARRELAELARKKVEEHESHQSTALTLFEHKRAYFIETSDGLGLGDKARTNEARLFMRYYTADQHRADKLERRLEYLKRNRGRHREADRDESFYEDHDMIITSENRNQTTHYNGMHIQNIPQAAPEPVKPKYSIEELDQMMRQAVRERIAGEMGVTIAPEPVSVKPEKQGTHQAIAFDPEPEFAHINWANDRSVTPSQRETMENLAVMDESPERDELVRKYFGTQELLMRAFNRFYGHNY